LFGALFPESQREGRKGGEVREWESGGRKRKWNGVTRKVGRERSEISGESRGMPDVSSTGLKNVQTIF
jgi:hypothetical protein